MKPINIKTAIDAYTQYTTARKRAEWKNDLTYYTERDKAEANAERDTCKEVYTQTCNDLLLYAINAAEGRATVRTVTPEKVVEALAGITAKLSITKKAMDGIEVHLDINAQDFPRAYKYTPESTQVCAVYKSGSWRVTDIYRGKCRTSGHEATIKHTEASKAALVERFTSFNI